MANKIPTFPVLRGLLTKYGLRFEDLGNIIDNCYPTISRKINEVEGSEFTFSDMFKIKKYFNEKGENLTIEEIFFEWKFTICEQKGA